MKGNTNVFPLIIFVLVFIVQNTCSTFLVEIHPLNNVHVGLLRSIESDQVLLSDLPYINKSLYISFNNLKIANQIFRNLTKEKIKFNVFNKIKLDNFTGRLKRSINDKKYLTWDEYENWIHSVNISNHPLKEVSVIGKSFEKRNIYCIKFGKNKNASNVIIESGTHAREWLAMASVIGVVDHILHKLKGIRNNYWEMIFRKYNVYFIPLLNPDGYAYTMKNDNTRFWRKNRQTILGSNCSGIDINRNFPVGFGNTDNPCSSSYGGSGPFSSPEAASFRNLILKIRDKLKFYISFHCFGQYILLPWAYKNEKVKDYKNMERVAISMQNALFKFGINFTIGIPGELIYNAGGTSFDWIKSLGVPFSYTIELFPETSSPLGFITSEEDIYKSTKEVYQIIKVALSDIK